MDRRSCDECGFDSDDYLDKTLLSTLRDLVPIWREMTEGLDATTLAAAGVDRLGGEDVAELDQRVAGVVTAARREGMPQGEALRSVEQMVHSGIHALRLGGRALHGLGAGAPHQVGELVQISASGGGVPKQPMPKGVVGRRGLEGDRQDDRLHHGRPSQALSLWSQEVIAALEAEGHPVAPGLAGENLTVTGIDWTTIRSGVRVAVGNEVVAEISGFATPCAKNAQWFTDGDFRRIDHDRHPGWSRAYAWVVHGGTVQPGDPVVVEPAGKPRAPESASA